MVWSTCVPNVMLVDKSAQYHPKWSLSFSTIVQSAAAKSTVLVADDTDLVILLCYYADPDGFALFMQCSTRGTTKENRIWDIKVTQSELGADICNNILFIHTILGWDTTSRLYGLGKGLSLKRFTSSASFRDKAEQFCKKDATVDDVIDAGEAALVCLYSGKEGENLDGLRYAKFCDKEATNKVHIYVLRLWPRPLQQRDTTVCEYTCRYSSGWLSAI